MANKPKGSYKDYLDLSSEDIKNLSEGELRGIVNKLNDTANKRARRLKQAGFESSSPALREREGKAFNISRKADKADLKSAYTDARNFLSGKTGSIAGTKAYLRQFDPLLEKVLGRKIDDPKNYDKRYKTPTLKKSAKDKIKNFWDEYDKYREIEKDKNPNKGDDYTTNLEDVSEFYEELYEEGETDLDDYEEKAEEDYLEDEGDYYDEGDEEEGGDVQPPQPKRGGKGRTKQGQHKASGKKYGKTKSTSGIRQRFEKIKIF